MSLESFVVRLLSAALLAAGLAVPAAVASAKPECQPDYSLSCYPETPAEQYFVRTTGPSFPNVGADQLVVFARQTCDQLIAGTSTGSVVADLAQRLGTTKQMADQVMDGAMQADCPHLTIGADGVAR